jgi:hypothetical protein
MFEDVAQKLKSFLTRRQQAYQQTFNPENQFAKRVLEDLAKFCRANETTFNADPRLHAVAEGRREVWLRIMNHTQLSPDQFWDKFGRKDLE